MAKFGSKPQSTPGVVVVAPQSTVSPVAQSSAAAILQADYEARIKRLEASEAAAKARAEALAQELAAAKAPKPELPKGTPRISETGYITFAGLTGTLSPETLLALLASYARDCGGVDVAAPIPGLAPQVLALIAAAPVLAHDGVKVVKLTESGAVARGDDKVAVKRVDGLDPARVKAMQALAAALA